MDNSSIVFRNNWVRIIQNDHDVKNIIDDHYDRSVGKSLGKKFNESNESQVNKEAPNECKCLF